MCIFDDNQGIILLISPYQLCSVGYIELLCMAFLIYTRGFSYRGIMRTNYVIILTAICLTEITTIFKIRYQASTPQFIQLFPLQMRN